MNCFGNLNEKDMTRIINEQVKLIIKKEKECQIYKHFHDEILNNEAIKKKFKEYENEIIKLNNEIINLKNEIIKLKNLSN